MPLELRLGVAVLLLDARAQLGVLEELHHRVRPVEHAEVAVLRDLGGGVAAHEEARHLALEPVGLRALGRDDAREARHVGARAAGGARSYVRLNTFCVGEGGLSLVFVVLRSTRFTHIELQLSAIDLRANAALGEQVVARAAVAKAVTADSQLVQSQRGQC